MRSVPTTDLVAAPDLAPAARLVLACLREQPDQNTARRMADGALAHVLGYEAVQAALVELRAGGLAREASGRWRLTGMGHDLRDLTPGHARRWNVTREAHRPVVSVTAVGHLRKAGARALGDELRRAAEDDPEIVLLDLSAALEIAAEGVEAVAEADERGRRGGARLVVIPGPERVQKAIARAGLAERLTFVAGRALAV